MFCLHSFFAYIVYNVFIVNKLNVRSYHIICHLKVEHFQYFEFETKIKLTEIRFDEIYVEFISVSPEIYP